MLNNKNILIVEDNEEIQFLLTDFLKAYGFSYACAYSVDEGIDILKRSEPKKFDLVLLDLLFPDKNGLYLINEVRSDLRYEDLKIMVISTLKEKKVILKALELGAEDYIAKPIDRDILSDKINSLISDTQLYSLPLLGVMPDAKYSQIEFDFNIVLSEVDEEGVIFFTDCLLPKGLAFDVQFNIFSDPNLQRINLKVISTQIIHNAVLTYETVAKFNELDVEQQLMIRRWLLANGRYEELD